jgi:hypothetical protein
MMAFVLHAHTPMIVFVVLEVRQRFQELIHARMVNALTLHAEIAQANVEYVQRMNV